jgi:ATP-dependent DNA helicase PIF1
MSAKLEELYYKHMSELTRTLTNDQKRAWSSIIQGKNVFITGAGGVGKSKLVEIFTKTYQHSKKMGITSTTGVSALLIGGTTIHSFAGIGLGKGSAEAMITTIMKKSYLVKRWRELEVLILDEISMLSSNLFDKLEKIARSVRRNEKPFGGIQLILSGDFCQLPCVDSPDICASAESWDRCIDEVIYMKEIIRQTDITFRNCLNDVRLANLTRETKKLLLSCFNRDLSNEMGIFPTRLFPLNYAVDYLNDQEMAKLPEGREFIEYDMEITVYPTVKNKMEVLEKHKKNCTAPATLQLCIGAQVMLLHNLDLPAKLANGSRGVVTGFVDDIPLVKFLNGEERLVDYFVWEIEENDKKLMSVKQIPLKVAYAMSIHKAQGVSLDYATVDLEEVFEYGQAYVALSRVRSLEGLNIIGLDFKKIKVHPMAKEFYSKH